MQDRVRGVRGSRGATAHRPALVKCLKTLQAGDALIVWTPDRLGRSLCDLIHLRDDLKHRGVKFRSLAEATDTDTATGRAIRSGQSIERAVGFSQLSHIRGRIAPHQGVDGSAVALDPPGHLRAPVPAEAPQHLLNPPVPSRVIRAPRASPRSCAPELRSCRSPSRMMIDPPLPPGRPPSSAAPGSYLVGQD